MVAEAALEVVRMMANSRGFPGRHHVPSPRFSCWFSFLSLYPWALRAQTTNASVAGRGDGPCRRPRLPDAKVAAVNTGTNFRW